MCDLPQEDLAELFASIPLYSFKEQNEKLNTSFPKTFNPQKQQQVEKTEKVIHSDYELTISLRYSFESF